MIVKSQQDRIELVTRPEVHHQLQTDLSKARREALKQKEESARANAKSRELFPGAKKKDLIQVWPQNDPSFVCRLFVKKNRIDLWILIDH